MLRLGWQGDRHSLREEGLYLSSTGSSGKLSGYTVGLLNPCGKTLLAEERLTGLLFAPVDASYRHLNWHWEARMHMGLTQYSEDGIFAPRKIAEAFHTTIGDVAWVIGLGKEAIQRKDRANSDKTQRRLRELVEVINKVERRFGSPLIAYAWYRSEPLAGFSGQTAMHLVRSGRVGEILEYIDAIGAGIHA